MCINCNGMMFTRHQPVWNCNSCVNRRQKPGPHWPSSFYRECVTVFRRRKWYHTLVTMLMCFSIDSSQSKMKPRSRTPEAELMTSFTTCSVRSMFSIFFRQALVPNQMASVFKGFNYRRQDEKHPWMATKHCCSRSMVDPLFNRF